MKEGRSGLDIRKTFFNVNGEAVEQDSQRNCEYPIPGSVDGQVRWGFE